MPPPGPEFPGWVVETLADITTRRHGPGPRGNRTRVGTRPDRQGGNGVRRLHRRGTPGHRPCIDRRQRVRRPGLARDQLLPGQPPDGRRAAGPPPRPARAPARPRRPDALPLPAPLLHPAGVGRDVAPRPANPASCATPAPSHPGRNCPSGSSGSPTGPPFRQPRDRLQQEPRRAGGDRGRRSPRSRSTSSWQSAAIRTPAASGPSRITFAWRPYVPQPLCSRAATRSSPTAASTASRRR